MFHSTNDLSIFIPISPGFRQQAETFAKEQPTSEKATQVYLNTLAVQVMNLYLQMMDTPTNLSASDSWHQSDRLCMDVADLYITGIGNLECRPIRAGEASCTIPAEVQNDRIGYVVIQIDEGDRNGRILGFVPAIAGSILPVKHLRSLEHLLVHLDQLKRVETPSITYLHQWFNNLFESKWQTLETAFTHQRPAVVFLAQSNQGTIDATTISELTQLIQTTKDEETRWRAAEALWTIDPLHPMSGVRRVIDLGMQLAGQAVALMVAILQKSDQSVAILLRVYPMGSQRYLPAKLQLAGLLEDDKPFLEAESRDRDDYIQLKFCAEFGEQFKVRVSLENVSITERFAV